MKLTVNGIERDLESAPLTSLLHVLREELGITSPKAGCQQGGCGACTVLVDGEPRRSCLVPLAAVDGASVTTVEGLGSGRRPLADPGRVHRGLRLAVRLLHSGFVIAAHALLEREPDASREEVIEGLSGHVCRCTGYVKIVDAVEAAARGDVDTQPPNPASPRPSWKEPA